MTRGEYDDGYALIDGEVVELNEVQLRLRNLRTIFCSLLRSSVFTTTNENGQQFRSAYHALRKANKVNLSLLKPLQKLVRPKWMGEWD